MFRLAVCVLAAGLPLSAAPTLPSTQPPMNLTDLPPAVMCAPTVQFWTTPDGQVIHTPTVDDCRRAQDAGLIRPVAEGGAPGGRAGTDQIDDYQWPQPGHSEYKDFRNAIRPRDTLQALWQQPGAGAAWSPWFGQPVVAESVVLNVDCYSGFLYCRNIDDGSLIWSAGVQRRYYHPCTPVLFEGTGGEPWVAVPKYDTGAMLYSMGCYRLSDGSLVWDTPLPVYNAASNLNFCIPTYRDGSIYHIVVEYQAPYGGHVVKVNALTGDTATLCRYGACGGGGLTIDPTGQYGFYPRWNWSSPGTDSCRILKIDLGSGQAVDSTPVIPDLLRGSAALNPAAMRLFSAGSLMDADTGHLYCFDANGLSSGYLWRGLIEGGQHVQSASIDDLNAYICTQSDPTRLYAFSQADGSVPANWPSSGYVNPPGAGIFDGAVVATGEVGGTRYLYLTPTGSIWVVNSDDGTTVQFQTTSENFFTGGARPAGFFVAKSGFEKILCWESPGDVLLIQNDVGVSRWTSLVHNLTTGSTYPVAYEVKNFGITPQSDFLAACVIQNVAGDTLYSDTLRVSLLPGDSVMVDWRPFTTGSELWDGYRMTGYTVLPGDERPFNDTCVWHAMTTGDTVLSNAGGAEPTFDGRIAPGEWDDAYRFDASNVFGWGGTSRPAGSAYVWFKHDNLNLYIACAMPHAGSHDSLDQVGFFCDENYDRSWPQPGDLSEGNYLFRVVNDSLDEVLYEYRTTGGAGQPQPVPGALSASSIASGYLVFEAKLPIGTVPFKLALNPNNDTAGVWLYARDGDRDHGWWPMMTSDSNRLDPAYYGTLVLRPTQLGDVGVLSIAAPVGSMDTGANVTPAAIVKNFGDFAATFGAWFFIDSAGTRIYTSTRTVTALPAGVSTPVAFDLLPKPHAAGSYATRCSVYLAGDGNAANDVMNGTFQFVTTPPRPAGWRTASPMPTGAKLVQAGGWLNFDLGRQLVYAARGNKTPDFYSYDIAKDSWAVKPAWPNGAEAKPPAKGSVSTPVNSGVFYAAKGNSTQGFWKYNTASDSWTPLANVPLGVTNKKVKGGGDLVLDGTSGIAYFLKGYKNEFWMYNTANDSWRALANAPGDKYGMGSWLALKDSFIYCHMAKTHQFSIYNIKTGAWSSAGTGMPLVGRMGKSKKSKDGGSAIWWENSLYALKGGNTQEFWRYTVSDTGPGTWTELDTVPLVGRGGTKKKKVKAGGDITVVVPSGKGMPADLPALKGNKTNELWIYNTGGLPLGPAPWTGRNGVLADKIAGAGYDVALSPNPLATGCATLRYSLPRAGAAVLYVYDVTGRAVLARSMLTGHSGSTDLDLRGLSAGVYLVELSAGSYSVTRKLVIQR